jgi:hypothetical protein
MTKGGTRSERRAAAQTKKGAVVTELDGSARAPPAAPIHSQRQQTEASAAPTSAPQFAALLRAISRLFHIAWRCIEISALVLSFAGVAYLVYDSYYQTKLAVNFAYSDATTAMDNPIGLRNNSNMFTIHDIKWRCLRLIANYTGGNLESEDDANFSTNIDQILPGGVFNISCNTHSSASFLKTDAKLVSALIEIHLDYYAKLGPISLHRTPDPIFFTWVGSIASPQWITGKPP